MMARTVNELQAERLRAWQRRTVDRGTLPAPEEVISPADLERMVAPPPSRSSRKKQRKIILGGLIEGESNAEPEETESSQE
jgi:hypothetical protein